MNNGLLEGVAFKQIHIQCVPGGVWLELGWIRTIRYLKRILWLLLWGCTNHILWISLRGCRKNILSCIPFLMFQLGSRKILHSLLSNLIAVYCLVRSPSGDIIEKPAYNVDIVVLRLFNRIRLTFMSYITWYTGNSLVSSPLRIYMIICVEDVLMRGAGWRLFRYSKFNYGLYRRHGNKDEYFNLYLD